MARAVMPFDRSERPTRRHFLKTLAAGGVTPLAVSSCSIRLAPAINVNGGRQLFIDDHLIAHTDLTRVYHQARYFEGNPILRPDTQWEEAGTSSACAMPYGDGVLFDPQDRLYKLWYLAGLSGRQTCLATSHDAYDWRKPDWAVVPGTNIVWPAHASHHRDSQSVIRDPRDEHFPFKMQSSGPVPSKSPQWLLGSPDGIHWRFLHETPATGDRTTMFYNPFRRKWVFSIREGGDIGGPPRHRRYLESDTFVPQAWLPIYWTGADSNDWYPGGANGHPPQLYCLDCVPYETLMLGLFTIFRGDVRGRPKLNEVCLGFSRDGFRWHRPDRRSFVGIGELGSWNNGNVQPAGGGCVVIGDTLTFFVSGRRGTPGTEDHGECSTGIATLRRDGFASLEGTGSVTTPPITFTGEHLFVNADVSGELRTELLDAGGTVLVAASDCVPISGDSTRHRVVFTDPRALAARQSTPVRLRFVIERAKLYAFWVTRSPEGRSGGFLAAGSPDANFEGRDYSEN